MSKQKLFDAAWQVGTFFAGVLITWLFLVIPTPRQFGLAFRYDFLPVIAPLVLLVFLVFQLSARVSRLLLFGVISAILVLPISGLWFSGQSEQYLLGGIIPFSDARSYFTDSRRLAEGSPFYTGASRRPLFTAMLTGIQWITGQNLYVSVAVLTVFLGLALYFAVEEFKGYEGPIAATALLIFLFCYSRLLLGKTLSEFAGLPLGCLALMLFLRGIKQKELKYFLAGLLMLSLGLNARAGAFIILPFIAIWVGWFFRKSKLLHWRSLILAFLAVIVGFAINTAAFRLYSSAESVPFGNFSNTIYGLARGGLGWTQIFTDYPESWYMPAEEQANFTYTKTFELIKRKPQNLFKGIVSSYQTFFSLDDYYGSIGWFGGQGLVGNIARVAFYLLLIAGLFICIKNFKKPERSFHLFAFLGILLSIPFAPPIDSNRMRVYAATIPFFAVLPALGLASLCQFIPWKIFKNKTVELQPLTPVKGLAIVILLLMTVIPLIPFKLTTHEAAPVVNCSTGLKAVSFRVLPGNHLRIIDQDSASIDSVPLIREKSFDTRIHNLPNWETYPLFSEVKPGQVILVDIDLQTMNPMILIADWDEVNNREGIQTVCGIPSTEKILVDYNVYHAAEYVQR